MITAPAVVGNRAGHGLAAGVPVEFPTAAHVFESGVAESGSGLIIGMMTSRRPVGTVTFRVTDMEGSTRTWEKFPAQTGTALKQRDDIVTQAIEAHNGRSFSSAAKGDSIFAVFILPE